MCTASNTHLLYSQQQHGWQCLHRRPKSRGTSQPSIIRPTMEATASARGTSMSATNHLGQYQLGHQPTGPQPSRPQLKNLDKLGHTVSHLGQTNSATDKLGQIHLGHTHEILTNSATWQANSAKHTAKQFWIVVFMYVNLVYFHYSIWLSKM